MRFRVPVVLLTICLPLGVTANAWAQSGTLQPPAHPPREQPVKPPTAAPRQPVHQAGSAASAPPVVQPKGSAHPHKPPQKGKAAADHAVAPAPADVKPGTDAPDKADAKAAEKLPDPEKPDGTVPKLPRFASLRSDDVNMRLGPGTRYRIEWVYKRRDLPVQIEREFDVWRWVRDPEGIHGWVHQATLMGRRNFIVQNADATLRYDPNDTAVAVAVLKVGVIGRIRSCDAASEWCNVQSGSYRGYLRRSEFWGVLPGEAVAP
jgi:SH3-like domain-containing protein